jgi:NAD(P)-dependent dehydrogenase (short-subunit alcohol dehydrogenase family)
MRRVLRDRVVVITGASSGIGRDCARRLASRGANVVLAARRRDVLEVVRDEITAGGGRAIAVQTDVTIRDDVQFLLNATLEHFGRADVWVNNAGYGMVARLEDTTPDEMRAIWETNFLGVLHGCQVALQQMRRQESGHIINVSSLAGRFALPLNFAYAATKHAVNALGQSLAMELEETDIRVSTIMPGLTDTSFFDATIRKIPAGRKSIVRPAPVGVVGEAIVRCALRPRDLVVIAPLGRWALVIADACPPVYRAIARRYLNVRACGTG